MSVAQDAIALAQAQERLRQEQELFDQRKAQDSKNHTLQLAMGWTTVVLLVAICAFCGYIVANSADFSAGTVTAATGALLVEAVGLLTATWRGNLGSGPATLSPTTPSSIGAAPHSQEGALMSEATLPPNASSDAQR